MSAMKRWRELASLEADGRELVLKREDCEEQRVKLPKPLAACRFMPEIWEGALIQRGHMMGYRKIGQTIYMQPDLHNLQLLADAIGCPERLLKLAGRDLDAARNAAEDLRRHNGTDDKQITREYISELEGLWAALSRFFSRVAVDPLHSPHYAADEELQEILKDYQEGLNKVDEEINQALHLAYLSTHNPMEYEELYRGERLDVGLRVAGMADSLGKRAEEVLTHLRENYYHSAGRPNSPTRLRIPTDNENWATTALVPLTDAWQSGEITMSVLPPPAKKTEISPMLFNILRAEFDAFHAYETTNSHESFALLPVYLTQHKAGKHQVFMVSLVPIWLEAESSISAKLRATVLQGAVLSNFLDSFRLRGIIMKTKVIDPHTPERDNAGIYEGAIELSPGKVFV